MPLGAEGAISEPNRGNGSCNAIFPKLRQIPKKNKDLVLTHADKHGSPALSSKHGVCTARKGAADAYDWNFCWKVWDALRDCAYDGTDCSTRWATPASIAPTAGGATASRSAP